MFKRKQLVIMHEISDFLFHHVIWQTKWRPPYIRPYLLNRSTDLHKILWQNVSFFNPPPPLFFFFTEVTVKVCGPFPLRLLSAWLSLTNEINQSLYEIQVTINYSRGSLVAVTSECHAKRIICKTWTGIWVNRADPDQMPQNAASNQGLHCLLKLQEVKVYVKQS